MFFVPICSHPFLSSIACITVSLQLLQAKMFRQISRIVTKANAVPTRFITSTAAKQKSAYAAQMHPESHAYNETPSDLSVAAAGMVVVGFFGLQLWNCSATANRIAIEDFEFKAFEESIIKAGH